MLLVRCATEEVTKDTTSAQTVGQKWTEKGKRMSDLISRQDAINLLEKWADGYNYIEVETEMAIKQFQHLQSVQPEPQWIPVKTRQMDSEEREYWEDQIGEKLEDEDAILFDCQMPEDGQEILVSYRKWICMDKCEIDDGCYGLEGNGDWEDVIAWMPLPKPYKTDGKGAKG